MLLHSTPLSLSNKECVPKKPTRSVRGLCQGTGDLPRFPRGSPLERFNEGLDGGAPQITSLGSGFIISPDGVVVTNNHVIEGADTIEVVLASGERLPADVAGRDMATDLAVLDVAGSGFAVIELAPDVEYDDVVAKTAAPITDQRRSAASSERDRIPSLA